MKKTTLFSALFATALVNAQSFSTAPGANGTSVNTGYNLGASGVLVSEPSDTATITGGNSVSCSSAGLHADNSYFRYFDIGGLGQIEITDIEVGVETASSGTGSTQPIVIRVYSIANGDALPSAVLTLVTESITTVADLAPGIANFPISAFLDSATQDLVVEVFTPDGQPDGHSFFIGSNASAQNTETFLMAADCGITEPTAVSSIGFPNMHAIMVVFGLANVPVELTNFSIE